MTNTFNIRTATMAQMIDWLRQHGDENYDGVATILQADGTALESKDREIAALRVEIESLRKHLTTEPLK